MNPVDDIRDRWAKATPGPWFWHGNTDNHNVALCGRQPGLGVCEVMSTINVDRDPNSRDAHQLRESLRDVTTMSDEQVEDYVREWAYENGSDSFDGTRTDTRLAITDANYIRHDVDTLAVYQVARAQGLPDDTPRDHPKVYRADVTAVRAPNAEALAHAWGDIHALLDENDRLRAEVATLRAAIDKTKALHTPTCLELHGGGTPDVCVECTDYRGEKRSVFYPCATLQALTPEDAEGHVDTEGAS